MAAPGGGFVRRDDGAGDFIFITELLTRYDYQVLDIEMLNIILLNNA